MRHFVISVIPRRITQRAATRSGVLLAALALGGCAAVYTTEPVGDVPVELDPEEWNGVWAESPTDGRACQQRDESSAVGETPADCLTLTVIEPQEGLLNVRMRDGKATRAWVRSIAPAEGHGTVDTTPGDRDVAPPSPGRSPHPLLVTFEDPEDTVGHRFELCCWIAMRDGRLVVWVAEPAAFRELAAQDTLPLAPGAPPPSGASANLGHLDERALAELAGPRRWDLFWWEDPLVLYRVREIDP